jgi:membrane protein DedA with SNARE-associated domain
LRDLVDGVLSLSGLAVYLIVGGLVLAEDVILVGLLVPGETAAILGGVAASRGQVHLVTMMIVVVVAATIGDSLGYAIGARYGPRLARTRLLRKRAAQIERGNELLTRRGGTAVVIGRYIPFLRAIIPFLAGGSPLRYRRFLFFDAIGTVTWGVAVVLAGYLAGNSYKAIEHVIGPAATGIGVATLIIAYVIWRWRRGRSMAQSRVRAETRD